MRHSCLRVALCSCLAASVSIFPANAPIAAQECGLSEVAVLATNSVHLNRDVVMSGDVAVNAASPGPTLKTGFELAIEQGSAIGGKVSADSIQRATAVTIAGPIACNDGSGVSCGGLTLPVFAALPAFEEAAVRPGSADIFVAPAGSQTLAAGSYGQIEVAAGATIVFSGGRYDIRSLSAGALSTVSFSAPSQVRIEGRLSIGQASVGPAASSGIGAGDIVIYAGGINGTDGALASLPAAVTIDRNGQVRANIYARNGAVRIDRGTYYQGAILARDVWINRAATVVGASAFGNKPPLAQPQTVFTGGTSALVITLAASDPEGGDLIFTVASGPSHGSLGAITPIVPDPIPDPGNPGQFVQPPITSATVTYFPDTPAADPPVADSFVFAATDPCAAVGMATIAIDPAGDPTPPPDPVDTVVALDGSAETAVAKAVTIVLAGNAPCDPTGASEETGPCDGIGDDVPLTFAIVGGPGHGGLSSLIQGSETPRRSALVTYVPAAGFSGSDSFDFEACGTVDGVLICDTATVTVDVFGQLANPQSVTTVQDTEVQITLTGTPGAGSLGELRLQPAAERHAAPATTRSIVPGKAAFLHGAAIAGNVADDDGDGFGDNHNDLPGAAPVLMAAAVDATGGPGSNGVVRMQIEWDLGDLTGLADDLVSAEVILHTQLGTVDALDTVFFVATGNPDGALSDDDFESPDALPIPNVVMPVPDVAVGTDGTFSFDVTSLVQAALSGDGQGFFTIQGRVEEDLAGGGFQRGLQVRTTADGNLTSGLEPQLALTTPGVTAPPIEFSITSLPTGGSLKTAAGISITSVPTVLASPRLIYTPNAGFSGPDEFLFQATDFTNVATARVSVLVIGALFDPCVAVGRPPGCAPSQ